MYNLARGVAASRSFSTTALASARVFNAPKKFRVIEEEKVKEVKETKMDLPLVGARQQETTVQQKILKQIKKKAPIITWLPNYTADFAISDVIAGVTVGLTVIPQGIAYATVANLPPQYGLYSAFMGCFMYCIFGSVKDITIGPTAIMVLTNHLSLM